jgi:hypothetical protein
MKDRNVKQVLFRDEYQCGERVYGNGEGGGCGPYS